MLLKFSDLHILCEALKAPTYLLQSIFFSIKVMYIGIWKQNIPNFNQMMLFFQSNPFFISAGTDCMILHRQYSQRPRKFRPGRTILKLVGTNNSKAINVKKKGQNYYYTAYLQGHHWEFKPGKTTRPQITERLCSNNRKVVLPLQCSIPQNQGKTAVLLMKD